MKKDVFLLGLAFLILFIGISKAKDPQDLIDDPTAYILERGTFSLNFRMYEGGGILTKVGLGFTDNIMLGVPIDVRNAIGRGDSKCEFPIPVCGKIKIIDERDAIPTISIGFDPYNFSQYGKSGDEIRPLLYISFTKSGSFVEFPIYWVFGVDNDLENFKYENACPFGGVSIYLNKDLSIMGEAEKIYKGNDKKETIVNAGIRYIISPGLHIEVDFKEVVGIDKSPDPIRSIRIGYNSKFF